MTSTSIQPRPQRSFARDVGVNVLANLIAAAIVYLLGAAAGLLPRSPGALIPATALVAAACFWILMVLVKFGPERYWALAYGVANYCAGVALVAGYQAFGSSRPFWLVVVYAGGAFLMGTASVTLHVMQRRLSNRLGQNAGG